MRTIAAAPSSNLHLAHGVFYNNDRFYFIPAANADKRDGQLLTEHSPLMSIGLSLETGYPKLASKRLLYLSRHQKGLQVMVIPLVNQNEIKNKRR